MSKERVENTSRQVPLQDRVFNLAAIDLKSTPPSVEQQQIQEVIGDLVSDHVGRAVNRILNYSLSDEAKQDPKLREAAKIAFHKCLEYKDSCSALRLIEVGVLSRSVTDDPTLKESLLAGALSQARIGTANRARDYAKLSGEGLALFTQPEGIKSVLTGILYLVNRDFQNYVSAKAFVHDMNLEAKHFHTSAVKKEAQLTSEALVDKFLNRERFRKSIVEAAVELVETLDSARALKSQPRFKEIMRKMKTAPVDHDFRCPRR